jgi:type I restriction enzyme S subunit
MREWRTKTIGDLLTLQRGMDLPDAERRPGFVPIMGSFGVTGWHNKAACDGPGVTVGRSGASVGSVSYCLVDFWPLNTCLYVRDFKGNNPRFCYYFLKTFDLASLNSGSAQPSLNRNFVHPIPARFPEPTEQADIARILGALDDKIDLNRRMNETLETMARATFKDWFVDFGPTRAKNERYAPYLAPEVWALFPDRLDEEEVPERWLLGTLEDVSALNSESWSRSKYPAHVDYVDLTNTKWGTIEAPERHDKETAPSRAQRVLRSGDTIVGTVRPGNGSFALVGDNGLTGSTGFAVLRPRRPQYREFVYLAATSPLNIDRLAHLADGAAYPAVHPEIVHSTEIACAGDAIIDTFHRTTAPLVDRVEANKREARTLAATRDLLLPKLMSGEIRLRDAEEAVEAVA